MCRNMVVFDELDMLVTSDPLAELDHALASTAARLRAARAVGNAYSAERLPAWIDLRLDQRLKLARDS